MVRRLYRESEFYSIFIRLAIPIAAQNLISSSLNLIDTVMVGRLGETELAATGIGNQIFLLLVLFLLGACGGGAIYTAQFWGKKDKANIKRILGLVLIISISAALLTFAGALIFPEQIISFFSKDTQVIYYGGKYLFAVSFSYVFFAISSAYGAVIRSTGEVKAPMYINIAAIAINTFLNYCLIYGNFGFPAYGVVGAAIATVIARFIEAVSLVSFVYMKKHAVAGKLNELFSFSKKLVKDFSRTTSALVAKDMIWGIGMTIYMGIYARMGTEVVAAMNIYSTIRQVTFVAFIGMANACLVMVGNLIGAGDEAKAYKFAKKFLKLSFIAGIIIGLFLFIGTDLMLLPYKVSSEVLANSRGIIHVYAASMSIIGFNMVAVVGVLRSGGDTMYCLIMDTVAVYIIGLPLAYLFGLSLEMSVTVVMIAVTSQEIFKFILLYYRYRSKKWINNLVHRL